MTLAIWIIVRLSESFEAHCGYEFPWSPFAVIPLSTPASYHFHHHAENVGNYATFFSLWDLIFGSNTKYYESI